MHIFLISLKQMLVLFFFIAIGYLLRKKKLLPGNTGASIAKLENLVLMPALIINVFMTNCTINNFITRLNYMLYCAIILLAEIVLSRILSYFFSKNPATRKVYRYSFVVANFAFVGNAIVQSVFGNDMLFIYMIFTLPLYLFTYSFGVAWLIPTKDGSFSWKCFYNPIFISLLIGIFLGLTSFPVPDFLILALSSASQCMSPLAMILTGFVVGGYRLKSVLSNRKVYFASLIRLILLPSLFVLILKSLHAPAEVIITVLCAFAAPLGLNTIIIPSAYDSDTNLGASMSLISHALSVITIPVMFLIYLQYQ
jgi:predicted permease